MHNKIPAALIDRSATEAPWLNLAFAEVGVTEYHGLASNNPRILEYISTFPNLEHIKHMVKDPKTKKKVASGYMMSDVDETAWCSCFVAWCLRGAGQPTPGVTARADSWLSYGFPLSSPRLGAIAVVYKKHANAATTSSGFHVAFYMDGPALSPSLLGGNQGNKVCAKEFRGWTVKGYRWPTNVAAALPSNVA
jgi:uncharacterized protein (TIGR02594 family)